MKVIQDTSPLATVAQRRLWSNEVLSYKTWSETSVEAAGNRVSLQQQQQGVKAPECSGICADCMNTPVLNPPWPRPQLSVGLCPWCESRGVGMASALHDLEWEMMRQTKLSSALHMTERNLNVQGGVEGRNHVGYTKFWRAGVRFSCLLTYMDAWWSCGDRLVLLLCCGQVSFLSFKDRVFCKPQIQERGLSGLKVKFFPMASASSGLCF